MSSCTLFVFASLMQFAIVNHFMGPVATRQMKGYSDEDIRWTTMATDQRGDDNLPARMRLTSIQQHPQYVTMCDGKEVAILIDKISRFLFPMAFAILNIVYWTTFLTTRNISSAPGTRRFWTSRSCSASLIFVEAAVGSVADAAVVTDLDRTVEDEAGFPEVTEAFAEAVAAEEWGEVNPEDAARVADAAAEVAEEAAEKADVEVVVGSADPREAGLTKPLQS
ncbi:unnamed protein product [Cyprideis torosa]|uniref:Uncharacterized protein n=1 Tax=Cyprideis torosa TaxID=163714 RepID=A0A7R8WI43_9CRUS|nr:unnamed protein product [Cyprideis torosa]CAG0900231.1 unnamed protein product [Cyprideis torosa]